MARTNIPFGTSRVSERNQLRQLRERRAHTTLLGAGKNEEEVYVDGSEYVTNTIPNLPMLYICPLRIQNHLYIILMINVSCYLSVCTPR